MSVADRITLRARLDRAAIVLEVEARRAMIPLTLAVVGLLAALALTDRSAVPAGGMSVVVGVGSALVLTQGIVGSERRSGVGALWLQKPVSPIWLYLERVGCIWLTTVLALGALLVISAPWSTDPLSRHFLRFAAFGLPLQAVAVSSVFAMSALGARADAIAALGVAFLLGSVAADGLLDPDAFGRWTPILTTLRLPMREISTLAAWAAGEAMFRWDGLVRIAVYIAGWCAIGAAATQLGARGDSAVAVD